MSASSQTGKEVDIDISGLMRQVRNKFWLILIISAVFAAVVFIGTSAISPRYKSNARILIEKQESVFTRSSADNSSSGIDADAIGSQVQLLSSDEVALDIIRKLDLINKPEFASKARAGAVGELMGSMGFGGEGQNATPEERILKEFRSRLQVFSAQNTRVIVIEFWAKDPKLAQLVPNTMAEQYIELQKKAKMQSNAKATGYLEPEIEKLRKQVRDAERKVADFRTDSDIMLGQNNSLLATQQLSEVSSELSRIKAERATAEATAQSIRNALKSGRSLAVIPEVISNPLIQRLRERQVGLKAQISELSTTLLPNHPKLKALKSQLADFDNQIRQVARNIQASLESNVGLNRQRERDLTAEVGRLKTESSRVGEAEVELRALEREAKSKRDLLESLLTRYREASSRINGNYLPVDARIISRAPLPFEHYFPKVLPFTIAGFVVAMILSIVGILAWALLSGKAFKEVGQVSPEMMPQSVAVNAPYSTPADVPSQMGSQMGGQMGAMQPVSAHAGYANTAATAPQRVAAPSMTTPIEAAAMPYPAQPIELVSQHDLVQALTSFNKVRLAFVSPGGEAGSQVTVEIARTLAESGRKTVVVDMSGRSTATNAMLGTNQIPGVYEILSGAQIVDNTLYTDVQGKVHVVGPGMEQKSADGYTIQRLQRMVHTLDANYDFVLIDCGTVELQSLTKLGDTNTMIIVNGENADLARCQQLEQEANAKGFSEVVTIAPRVNAPHLSPDSLAA